MPEEDQKPYIIWGESEAAVRAWGNRTDLIAGFVAIAESICNFTGLNLEQLLTCTYRVLEDAVRENKADVVLGGKASEEVIS